MNHLKHILCSVACTAMCLSGLANEPAEVPEQIADTVETSVPAEILRLTETDYEEVAQMLGVETAAIKAVVDIEAGKQHQGFFAPGKPIINFDLSMFRRHARRNGINLSRYTQSHPAVFSRPNTRRHGTTQAAQHARLKSARSIDETTAMQGTFWGMFQIGGFNWKLCGCESIEEFEERMCHSEREQLELFANFIRNSGMDKALRDKNWAAFARRYNGPSYAKRGYHTRMATAYKRHKEKEKQSAQQKDADSDSDADTDKQN